MKNLKKLLCAALAVVMLCALAACGGDTPSPTETPTEKPTEAPKEDASTPAPTEEPASEPTEEPAPESTPAPASGEIVADAAPVDSNILVIEGSEVTFPCAMTDFLALGWSNQYLATEKIEAGQAVEHYAVSFTHDGSGETRVSCPLVRNNGSEEAPMLDCELLGLRLHGRWDETDQSLCNFILPGGITANSTALDVQTVFGTESTALYEVHDTISYEDGYLSLFEVKSWGDFPYDYSFEFNTDGSLKYVYVRMPNFSMI